MMKHCLKRIVATFLIFALALSIIPCTSAEEVETQTSQASELMLGSSLERFHDVFPSSDQVMIMAANSDDGLINAGSARYTYEIRMDENGMPSFATVELVLTISGTDYLLVLQGDTEQVAINNEISMIIGSLYGTLKIAGTMYEIDAVLRKFSTDERINLGLSIVPPDYNTNPEASLIIMAIGTDVVSGQLEAAYREYAVKKQQEMEQLAEKIQNMYDELEASGNTLDYHLLSKLFGVPMLPTVSKKNRGLDTLFHVVINLYEGVDFFDKQGNMNPEVLKDLTEWHDSLEDRKNHEEEHLEDYVREHKKTGRVFRHIHINHGPDIEKAIEAVKSEVSKNEFIRHKYSTRFLSIKLLENDPDIERIVRTLPNADEIFHVRDKMSKRVQDTMNEDCESAITDAKYGFISGALKETFTDNHLEQAQTTKVLDSIVTHRVWGFPIFFLFMYLMFEGTFVIGEYPMMGIEWLVEQIGDLIRNNMTDGPLKDMLVDGIVGGVGGVIVFLPNILILYFCISLMEDSGYMARAAFIMDKIMHKMGLHGKSFIPLIMGFGCNVPAIMASRTIENRKSRLITMLINPLMSCSARLPIYLLLVGAFFPNNASLVLLSIYAIGIFLAVLLARLFSKFLVKGDDTPFVMELPPYRMPTAKSIFRHTWEKGAQYLKKMGGIIMVASVIIWFLGYYPNHDAYETVAEQQENSYIGQLGRAIEPVIEPMGFDWKLGIGLISGVGAKELVVSTLGVLYVDDPDADSVSLAERIPITPLVAFCYMLFVLIYFPCIAALAAIKQESGSWKWALFAACYTTVLAWLVSFAVYQIGGLFV